MKNIKKQENVKTHDNRKKIERKNEWKREWIKKNKKNKNKINN